MNTILLEETENGLIPVDVYSKLAKDRVLFLHNQIDDQQACDIVATLLNMDMEDSNSKITLIISSEGGDIRSIYSIYDTMQIIESPIETFCMGEVFDEAVLLLAAGTPGMRHATPNSVICPSQLVSKGMMFSDISDASILMDRLKRDNTKYIASLALHTGQPKEKVMKDFERKKFFTAKQALQYGIIDSILQKDKAK